ncbi:MAG: error-prone DNA polymerase, partial [Thalassolituus oleivorans]
SAPNEVADLLEDYHSMGVTLGRHPIEILREQGHLGSSITALGLRQLNHGDECFVSGLVTCRQRPGTAAGVTFVTLEDETGCTNVVVWLRTAQQQLQTLLNARIMQVYGHVEKDINSGVTHLMAYRLLDLSSALKQLEIKSHDFH